MTRPVGKQTMDSVLRELGWRGRYQVLQTIQHLSCYFPVAFHTLSIMFIGRNIHHKCRELDNSTSSRNVSYAECSVTLMTNMSETDSVVSCPNGHRYVEPQDRSTVSEWDLVCEREFWSDVPQTMIMLGMCAGAILVSPLADKYGRKPLHVGCHLGLLVLGIVTAFVPNFESFLLLRFLLGGFQQGTSLTSRVLLMELMPAENRRATSICASILYSLGMVVLAGIAFLMKDLSWRYLQLVLAGFSAHAVLQICFTDESLRWLTANGKEEEAERILVKAMAMNRVNESDVLAIFRHKVLNKVQHLSETYKPSDEQNKTEKPVPETKWSVKDFFRNRRILLCSAINVIMCIVAVSQKKACFSGQENNWTFMKLYSLWGADRTLLDKSRAVQARIANNLTYFGLAMTSGTLVNSMYIGFALSAVMDIPGALAFFFMIDRIGRRKCCMVFHLLAGTSLVFSVLVTSLGGGESARIIVTVLVLTGKFAINAAFATIILYTPEQYPTNLRNLSLGMGAVASRIGGMLAPYARTLARHVPWLPGTVFGICCILVSILARMLPETSGRELPQTIDDMIEQNSSVAETRKGKNCSTENFSTSAI